MAYRNGTYVAFDGNGSTDPTKGDLKYYGLLRKWNSSKKYDLNFSDSHTKTYQVQSSSNKSTLQNRLLERMRNSKNLLVILSEDTNWDRGMLNYEIEKAVDYYELPLIVAYTGCTAMQNPILYKERWPKALKERIDSEKAKCIHIPFKEKAIMNAVTQFSIGDNTLLSPLTTYKKEVYVKWGYIQE